MQTNINNKSPNKCTGVRYHLTSSNPTADRPAIKSHEDLLDVSNDRTFVINLLQSNVRNVATMLEHASSLLSEILKLIKQNVFKKNKLLHVLKEAGYQAACRAREYDGESHFLLLLPLMAEMLPSRDVVFVLSLSRFAPKGSAFWNLIWNSKLITLLWNICGYQPVEIQGFLVVTDALLKNDVRYIHIQIHTGKTPRLRYQFSALDCMRR